MLTMDWEKYHEKRRIRNRNERRPKLTLKSAKALAIQEFGTAKGLTSFSNNTTEYQRYEMMLGNCMVVISNYSQYWGFAQVSFEGIYKYFDINTLEENHSITDHERELCRLEQLRDTIQMRSKLIFQEILKEYGYEQSCEMLNQARQTVR